MTATTFKDNIGKEDIRHFGGNNRTFQRRNSAGALLTLHSVGNVVDVLQAYGDGTTPTQTDLSDAIVGANGNEATFELAPGTWPITSNLTIPSTVTVHLLRGAAFSVSTGVTLTLSGPVIAQESTWYAGAGTVVYTAGGGFFPLVSDLASVAAGKGAALIGATGVSGKTIADLFDGGKDVTIKPLNIDAGGTLDVAGASTLAAATTTDLSASGTLGGKLAFRGARINMSGDQAQASGSTNALAFGAADIYDTDSIHDPSTNNTRVTIPAGITYARIQAQIAWESNATGVRDIEVYKNGPSGQEPLTGKSRVSPVNGGDTYQLLDTGWLSVTAADYYELYVVQNSGSQLNVLAVGTFASIQLR